MGYGASKGADPVMNSKINTPNIHLGGPISAGPLMTVPIFLVVRWEYMGKENQFPETQVFQVEKDFWSSSVFKIHQPQKLIRMNTLPIKILASVASSKDKRFTSCKMFHKNLNWNVKLMVNWVVEIRMPWQTTNLSDLLFACWLRQLAKITKCAHKSYPAVNKHSRERQLFQSPIYNIYIYIHTHKWWTFHCHISYDRELWTMLFSPQKLMSGRA